MTMEHEAEFVKGIANWNTTCHVSEFTGCAEDTLLYELWYKGPDFWIAEEHRRKEMICINGFNAAEARASEMEHQIYTYCKMDEHHFLQRLGTAAADYAKKNPNAEHRWTVQFVMSPCVPSLSSTFRDRY